MNWQRAFQPLAGVTVGLALICGAYFCGPSMAPVRAQGDAKPRFFEMRTYIANEGKFDALNARFRNHTNALFIKHGITPIAYWIPTDGDEAKTTLVYVLAGPSREAYQASWKAFAADPVWLEAKAASEKEGKLVAKVESKFMTAVDYSPMK